MAASAAVRQNLAPQESKKSRSRELQTKVNNMGDLTMINGDLMVI